MENNSLTMFGNWVLMIDWKEITIVLYLAVGIFRTIFAAQFFYRSVDKIKISISVTMDSFVRNFYQYIVQLRSEQYNDLDQLYSFIVDRYQDFSNRHSDLLKKTNGGLISFNNFLSTSKYRGIFLTLFAIIWLSLTRWIFSS